MSTLDADRYRNAPPRASSALYIPVSALTPNQKRHDLHERETVEEAKQLRAMIYQHMEAVAVARGNTDALCYHKNAINELRKKLAEVDALLGKQERGVA